MTEHPVEVYDSRGLHINLWVLWFDTDTGEVCHQLRDHATRTILANEDWIMSMVERFPCPLTWEKTTPVAASSGWVVDELSYGVREISLCDGRRVKVRCGPASPACDVSLPNGTVLRVKSHTPPDPCVEVFHAEGH